MALLVVLVVAHTVSSIDSTAAKQVSSSSSVKAKTQDDLYIDDEGDDDIQLQDEASGSGPSKPRDSRVEASDLDEEEEEEDEDEEEDEEDSVPVVVEANKAKDVAPPVGVSSSDFKEDDAPSPPKVSPVAASPSFPAAKPVHDDDEEEEDEDYNVQGSGAGNIGGSRGTGTSVGRDGGSGAGSISGVDDEDEEEEDYDDNSDVEDIDINSVITEPETPRPPPTPVKPEKKPEVVVVAPPAPQPTKAPVDRGFPTAPTTVTTPPMIEVRSEKAPSTTEQPSTTTTTVRSPPIGGSSDRAGADPGSDVHILDHKPEDRPTSFFAQPGILAAVIGGAVVGLLCAILLVMFIVYRMRKKDEGSYVLDEPKRSSPNSHPYNKNSREFYA